MKSFNIIFLSILVSCIGLSFVGKSNFEAKESQTIIDSANADAIDSIPAKDMKKLSTLLQKELLEPIRAILEAKDPHIFMTKCYSQVSFDVKDNGDQLGVINSSLVQGQIVFVNCSVPTAITSFVADLKEDKVHLWESYKRPNVSTKDFLAEFKAYVNEHGVPGN